MEQNLEGVNTHQWQSNITGSQTFLTFELVCVCVHVCMCVYQGWSD